MCWYVSGFIAQLGLWFLVFVKDLRPKSQDQSSKSRKADPFNRRRFRRADSSAGARGCAIRGPCTKSHLEEKLARTVTRYRTPTRRGSERDQDISLSTIHLLPEPIFDGIAQRDSLSRSLPLAVLQLR